MAQSSQNELKNPKDLSERRARWWTFLEELSRNPATANGELEQVARIVTERCTSLLDVDRVGIWLFDEHETQLKTVDLYISSANRHSAGDILREKEFFEEFQYLKTSLYVDASDAYTDPRTARYRETYLKPNQITSMLDVVIRFGGRNLGVICFEHTHQPHVWEPDEIDFGCLIGAQLSILFERRALRRAEQARNEIQERLEAVEALDALKVRFFSNTSHEFRTPLTLLLGPIENLLSGTKDKPTEWQKAQLSVARRGALRLLKLVNNLMDSIRIGADRAQAIYRPTQLSAFTKDLASQFEPVMSSGGLKLKVDCEAMSEATYVDRDMWEKIVLNLLSNAFKFTFEGEVVMKLRQVGSFIELIVSDTGVGISADALPRIFDRYYRVTDARGRTMEGTGIGLALVKEFVQLLGGTVNVESKVGVGTTFQVRIPRGDAHIPKERLKHDARELPPVGPSPLVDEALGWIKSAPQQESTSGKTAGRSMGNASELQDRPRILIVDDSIDMLSYLSEYLGRSYDVEGCSDGSLALKLLSERKPDLIVSDIVMPRLDGFDLLRMLRADPETASIPVILLSARIGEDAAAEALTLGADDYLSKPFSVRELTARVQNLVMISRTRRVLQDALSSEERDLEKLAKDIIAQRT